MGRRTTAEKHIHKVIKVGPVWKCAFPHCKFFVYFAQAHVILGRAVICWDCESEFVLDEAAMKDDMPTCPSCRIPDVNSLEVSLGKQAGS